MSREEAIRILDPETTFEALTEIDYYNGFSGKTAQVEAVNEACVLAVAALREQEERSKGCEFCKEDKDGFRQMVGSFSLSNPFHKGEYYLNCGKAKPIRIYDCPMCGRKLEVEG